jgi:hypothetical protein
LELSGIRFCPCPDVVNKKPSLSGSGLMKFVNESKPNRRAGQQRVCQQQA